MRRVRSIGWLVLAVVWTGCADPVGPNPMFAPMAAVIDPTPTRIQIYGSWHCGNDFCTWGAPRDLTEFDNKNRWLVDRGDGRPSVNLVVLSFVHPYRLLKKTTDAQTLNGIPRGMTPADRQLLQVPRHPGHALDRRDHLRIRLESGAGRKCDPARAQRRGSRHNAGRRDRDRLRGEPPAGHDRMQTFINAYRSVHPYDATGANHPARLTIDLAAGDRWLIDLTTKATRDWLRTDEPVLDYANAMVPARQPTAAAAMANWQEHVDGKPQYAPPIPPLAPAKFTGSLYIADGGKAIPECVNYAKSLQAATRNFVQGVLPNGAGTTAGMLGFMFWAAERPSTRGIGTVPPNSCENGVGTGATALGVPISDARPATAE